MKPSVGRIVHYCLEVCEGPVAAIVVRVYEGTVRSRVDLVFFAPTKTGLLISGADVVPNAPEFGVPGTWSWPPRDDGR